MKDWIQERDIHAPIEKVWNLLDGSLADMQKVMPTLVENEPIEVTDHKVGSIYRQKYRLGKRVQIYDVKTLEYENNPYYKKIKIQYTHANTFEITSTYELKKMAEDKTNFCYKTSNKPLKWYVKPFMLLSSDKVAVQFANRVKQLAESE